MIKKLRKGILFVIDVQDNMQIYSISDHFYGVCSFFFKPVLPWFFFYDILKHFPWKIPFKLSVAVRLFITLALLFNHKRRANL